MCERQLKHKCGQMRLCRGESIVDAHVVLVRQTDDRAQGTIVLVDEEPDTAVDGVDELVRDLKVLWVARFHRQHDVGQVVGPFTTNRRVVVDGVDQLQDHGDSYCSGGAFRPKQA